ncbi:GntR family transcriptional regulator [Allorhizobium sp. NPDC080224]|uniref:GntR family transcriptional regulator n=1 Tax=Allorhizobium sp. NPDC080224 TaxID=3390547 RepID=UPI003CFD0239
MSETVAQRIARIVGEKIVSGELAPGATLRQDHIGNEFGASHVPAREALQLLRAQGLVISLPRRGMRVSPIDPASIQETIEIRAALETLALRLAAPKMNATSFERIELALVACDMTENIVDWETANRAFHRELVSACRMPRLLTMLDDLQLAISRIIFSASRSGGWRPGSSTGHRQIVDALKKGDHHTAVALLDAHIRGLERATAESKLALNTRPSGPPLPLKKFPAHKT